MRVSLQIDGDASGAQQASQAASSAVTDLGKQTEAIAQAIEEGFKKASGAVDGLSQAAGAANDNAASSALGFAGKLSQVASAAAGADSALAKGATGAINFAKGIGDAVKAVGVFNVAGAILGLAVTAATTFYSVVNSGAADANKRLDDQARLIGVVKDAFSGATGKADEFYRKNQDIVTLQASQALIGAQADLRKRATEFAAGNSSQSLYVAPFGGEASIGFDIENAAKNIGPFQKAIDDLHGSIAVGKIDIATYRAEVAKIGNAAQGSNPEIAAQAAALLKASEGAADAAESVAKFEAILAVAKGTATEAQKALLGVTSATTQTANDIERFTKSMERQSAAQEAEARAVGGSVGALARLRAESILLEAAQQAGGNAAQKYADQIAKVAARAGDAAQALAVAKLQSDQAFQRSQLGRSADEAAVADQLRGAFGDKADLDGSIASAVRFNNEMRELKATTQDLASGAFRDFRSELQATGNAWEAMSRAAINALDRIIAKLGDKAFDQIISSVFGTFLGGGSGGVTGSIAIGDYLMPKIGFDDGGWTGSGGKHEVAGVVHRDEFVFNKEATNRIGIGNLERLHRGYADGGLVGGPAPWGAMSSAPAGSSSAPQRVHVTFGVDVDGSGNLQPYVKQVSTQSAGQVLSDFVGSEQFIVQHARAQKEAQSRVMI